MATVLFTEGNISVTSSGWPMYCELTETKGNNFRNAQTKKIINMLEKDFYTKETTSSVALLGEILL